MVNGNERGEIRQNVDHRALSRVRTYLHRDWRDTYLLHTNPWYTFTISCLFISA